MRPFRLFEENGLETILGETKAREVILASLKCFSGHEPYVNPKFERLKRGISLNSAAFDQVDELATKIEESKTLENMSSIGSSSPEGYIAHIMFPIKIDFGKFLPPKSTLRFLHFYVDVPDDEEEYLKLKKRLEDVLVYHDDQKHILVNLYGPNIQDYLDELGKKGGVLDVWARTHNSRETHQFYMSIFRRVTNEIMNIHSQPNDELKSLEDKYYDAREEKVYSYLERNGIDITPRERKAMRWFFQKTKNELAKGPQTVISDCFRENFLVYFNSILVEDIMHVPKIDFADERKGPDALDWGYFFATQDFRKLPGSLTFVEYFIEEHYLRYLPLLISNKYANRSNIPVFPDADEYLQQVWLALGFRGFVMATYDDKIEAKERYHCVRNGMLAYERYTLGLQDLSDKEGRTMEEDFVALKDLGIKMMHHIQTLMAST